MCKIIYIQNIKFFLELQNMVDFINQIIKFQNVNIDVKPIYILHKKEFSQILICEEIQTKNLFCIKALFSDKDDIYLLNS